MSRPVVGVIGSTGFVGRSVVKDLDSRADIVRISAPRQLPRLSNLRSLPEDFAADNLSDLVERFRGLDVVINAAGIPDASSRNEKALLTGNAALPLLALRACRIAGVQRFLHVSSAVVQGDAPQLDSTPTVRPFSPYSRSKALAERWLLEEPAESVDLVIYRPPSVHARGRGVTDKVARIAGSFLGSVAGSGTGPSPQALLPNVASAIGYLALVDEIPPMVVHHPWEGLSTAELMRTLGGREPRHLPWRLSEKATAFARTVERIIPALSPYRRRVEMMWFGQDVAPSWLTQSKWKPPIQGLSAWRDLVRPE